MKRHPKKRPHLTAHALWQRGATVHADVDAVLPAAVNLPLRYWRERMLFWNAPDDQVHHLTQGRFPARLVRRKTHPVFALQALPDIVGFRVCPCSSARPWRIPSYRYIRKDCILEHTGKRTDRDSFLVEEVIFNIPAGLAFKLRFGGQVPPECLTTVGDRRNGVSS